MKKNSSSSVNMESENLTHNALPYNTTDSKGKQVEQLFDSIAEKYDLLNAILSMGIDKSWRRKGINCLKSDNPKTVLDIATGTGDLAIVANKRLKPDLILGIDISESMLKVGEEKVAKLGLSDKIHFSKKDCMALDIDDDSFDAATVAFGIRNFENLAQGLKEILRVLKPGGKLMILELTTPQSFPMKQLYTFYSKVFIPNLGRLISKDQSAYTYLPNSIKVFVHGEELKEILLECGFSQALYKRYTLGICTMYLATK